MWLSSFINIINVKGVYSFYEAMNMEKIVGTLPRDHFKLADRLTQVTTKSGATVLLVHKQ